MHPRVQLTLLASKVMVDSDSTAANQNPQSSFCRTGFPPLTSQSIHIFWIASPLAQNLRLALALFKRSCSWWLMSTSLSQTNFFDLFWCVGTLKGIVLHWNYSIFSSSNSTPVAGLESLFLSFHLNTRMKFQYDNLILYFILTSVVELRLEMEISKKFFLIEVCYKMKHWMLRVQNWANATSELAYYTESLLQLLYKTAEINKDK